MTRSGCGQCRSVAGGGGCSCHLEDRNFCQSFGSKIMYVESEKRHQHLTAPGGGRELVYHATSYGHALWLQIEVTQNFQISKGPIIGAIKKQTFIPCTSASVSLVESLT